MHGNANALLCEDDEAHENDNYFNPIQASQWDLSGGRAHRAVLDAEGSCFH